MRRFGFVVTTLTLVLAAFAAPSVQASEGVCSAQLAELSRAETTLSQLQEAHSEGEATRRALRQRIFDVMVEIELLALDGADAKRIAPKRAELSKLEGELATSVKVAPVVDKQIRVLAADVDAAQRQYVACVEATIE